MPGLTQETALGFTIVWIGFGAGLIAVYLAVVGDRRTPRSLLVAVPAAATLGALFLPAIRGIEAATGDRIVLTSWSGLDAISVAMIVVLLVAVVVWSSWACAASTVLLLGGNLLIQATTLRGTEVQWGLPVALGCSIATLAVAGAIAVLAAGRASRAG